MIDLPRSLDQYRHLLERAVAADLVRRRRRRRVRAGAVAAVLAGLVVILNVLPGGDAGRGLGPSVEPASAVERAAAALTTDRGTILHIHMLGRQFEQGRPDIRWESEAWVAADRFRTIERPPAGGVVAESERGAGFDRLWDPDGNRVVEAPSPEPSPTFAEDKFRAEALAYLRSGHARVTGPVRVAGRDALKIVAKEKSQVFIVDARTYAPIEFRTRGTLGGTVLRFETYERIPRDEGGEDLLSIAAQHGGAPVVRDEAAFRAAQARLFPNG